MRIATQLVVGATVLHGSTLMQPAAETAPVSDPPAKTSRDETTAPHYPPAELVNGERTLAQRLEDVEFQPNLRALAQSAKEAQNAKEAQRDDSLAELEHRSALVHENGADPSVVKIGEYFYYTHTTGDSVKLWRSTSLMKLCAGEAKEILPAEMAREFGFDQVWAPEIQVVQGELCLYFSGRSTGDFRSRRMWAMKAVDPNDPFGRWELKGKVADPFNDTWAIDGTVLTDRRGAHYFVWSGWPDGQEAVDEEKTQQCLYIAKMKDPWTIEGPRVCIARPDKAWEKITLEGPAVFQKDGRTKIVYAADRFYDNYTLGCLDLVGDDVLNPASWKKCDEEIVSKKDFKEHRLLNVGHCTFASVNGRGEDIVFLTVTRLDAENKPVREVRMQRAKLDADGALKLGTILPLDRLQ